MSLDHIVLNYTEKSSKWKSHFFTILTLNFWFGNTVQWWFFRLPADLSSLTASHADGSSADSSPIILLPMMVDSFPQQISLPLDIQTSVWYNTLLSKCEGHSHSDTPLVGRVEHHVLFTTQICYAALCIRTGQTVPRLLVTLLRVAQAPLPSLEKDYQIYGVKVWLRFSCQLMRCNR